MINGRLPSIFNDVIGPVMRGPSSSHCAAALRIGRLALDLAGGHFEKATVEFDPNGSLATTHTSQGSDMGLFGGLLGFEADDDRLPRACQILDAAGVTVNILIRDIGANHPNTYKLTLEKEGREYALTANSVGGGMIEVTEINGFPVSLAGDAYFTLLHVNGPAERCMAAVKSVFDADGLRVHRRSSDALIEITARSFLPVEAEAEIRGKGRLGHTYRLNPVLPVLSRPDMEVPFESVGEMLATGDPARAMSEFALDYECARSGWTREAVLEKMAAIVGILRNSIKQGLAGTSYKDRILGYQSGRFEAMMSAGQLLDGGLLNRMVLYVTALMEVKSSMGVIVAAPTAGSCATCPGACLATAETVGASEEATARVMLTAGLVGIFAAIRTSFAAEVGGCQAETGVGSAMAAAALVELAGGDTVQSLAAASMALQNVLGLVCDPIANRVEAPCLGRNVAGAANALSSANMALAGFDPLIPLDQVLDAHREISESMPRELRCTALGGLSVTPASKAIEQQLCGNGCGR